MEEEQIRLTMHIASLLTAVLVFTALGMLGSREHRMDRLLRTYQEISGFLRKRSHSSPLYQRIDRWLTENERPFIMGGRWSRCGLLLQV